MLLMLIAREEPPDEVVFYNSGMEFEALYRIRDRVLPLLERHGIRYTELAPEHPFLYDMFEREVHARDGSIHYGYSWCGGRCRWGQARKHRPSPGTTGTGSIWLASPSTNPSDWDAITGPTNASPVPMGRNRSAGSAILLQTRLPLA